MMDNNQPILTRKKLLFIGGAFLVVLMSIAFVIIYRNGPSQDMPDYQEELQFNFVSEGSKIAGIQVLVTNGGLSNGQYKKVCKALGEKLPELEPDSRYFLYVEESLGSEASSKAESMYNNVDVSPVEGGDEGQEYTREIVSERNEMEMVDTVVFTMVSESGAEYNVEVYTAGGLTKADVTVEKK